MDLIVVGGGPAGSAAAIWAARLGLRVRLMERCAFPRHRPGETLHPGVEPIFSQLGVTERVSAASGLRHEGHEVTWAGRTTFERFGADAAGAWTGYQVEREVLDAILLARARELGVDVVQPEAALEPIVHGGRVVGVRGRRASEARYVVDAAGGRGWLARHLQLPFAVASPPLRAYYGYCEGDGDEQDAAPCMTADGEGWTWTAQVAPRRFNWTRLSFAPGAKPTGPPLRLAGHRQLSRARGADVTWRQVPACAGEGYFAAGDAAAVVDPAASHGVLRALMSGMMVAHAIARIVGGSVAERDAVEDYHAWIGLWFAHDVARLSELYRQLDPGPAWLHKQSPGGLAWPRR